MQMTLKAARVNAGLSCCEAAKMLGISRRTLLNYEQGIALPRIDMVKRMMGLYAVSLDDINFYPETTIK